MKTISRAQEQKIVSAAERVVDLVNQGATPNDALYKVASDEQLNPHFVRRLAEVFNTSRQLAHFKNASAEHRADPFPLADSASVIARMYPAESAQSEGVQKAAGQCMSTWFAPPPDFSAKSVKQAAFAVDVKPSHGLTDANMLLKRARLREMAMKRNLEVAKNDVSYQRELASESITKAAAYFRAVVHTPFETVETNLLSKYGAAIEPLMTTIYNACRGAKHGEKRGAASTTTRIYDHSVEPYTHIETALRSAREWQKAAAEEAAIRDELTEFAQKINTTVEKLAGLDKERIPFPFEGIQKDADITSALAGWLMGPGAAKFYERSPKEPMPGPLSMDPGQEDAMRGARMESTLNDFITNDNVISRYDPRDVAVAFNELAELAPRVVEHPALLRGMLSRRLEMGRVEPFEAGQAVDTESTLKRMNDIPSVGGSNKAVPGA